MSTAVVQDLKQYPCVELVNYYCPGGFHPVHLDDTFKNGRYRVIHKLGYGSYGTVWLVHDTISKRYASLKILAADASRSRSEVAVIQHLQQHATGSGKEYVVEVFDVFEHIGPNGLHHCIVMEVLGPPISSDIEEIYPDEIFPIEIAKRMSTQVAHGLAYIQKAGIVHGDPTQIHVKICDFGEASIPTMQLAPPSRGIPVVYAAPEVIFGDPIGSPADIWALAVLIRYIISGGFLFPSFSLSEVRKDVIRSMVLVLGKLPERWWSKWEERGECFNEDREWGKDGFRGALENGQEEGEISQFNEILKRMVKYDPGERVSINEVIEWMNQNAWFVN
ncbi:hypothetical protein Clacol_009727 [Clathrus columnatus]|uniref:non-specific serine/threonine protein kinase n=1 Tax=Clathrus columnatus TaxID=1419009 RepID=A0AAV5ALF1_9AGAM|nr:hypothetical protein Clacol_009727 [Clathrus columnatus]